MQNIRWGTIAAIFALVVSVLLGIFSGVSAFHIFIRALIFAAIFFGFGFGLRYIIDNFFPDLLLSAEESEKHDLDQSGSQINITVDSFGEYAVPELYKTPDGSEELGNIESLISGAFKPRSVADERNGRDKVTEKAPEIVSEKPPADNWFESSLEEESVDLKKDAGYNDIGSFDNVFEPPASAEKPVIEKPQFSPSFGDDFGLGGLPDLDMMARAFSSGGEGNQAAAADFSSSPVPIAAPAPVSTLDPVAPETPFSFLPSAQSVENSEPERERYVGNKPQPLEGNFDPKDLAKGISTILSKD